MFTFEITPYDTCLYKLSIGKVFKRYVNKLELERIVVELNDYLSARDYDNVLTLDNSHKKYIFQCDDNEIKEIETLLLVGREKQIINLPAHLKQSHGEDESKEILLTYRPLDEFKHYWTLQGKDKEKELQLLKLLSEDLLQIPYTDKPHDYDFFRGRVAFHTNHGTTHGLRLMVLFDYYLETLISHDREKYRLITLEERSCLKLALFLFRSGRTNEVGWSGDPTYSLRSAAVFKQIALELGYPVELVHLISLCFDYNYDLSLDAAIMMSEKKIAQGIVYQQLFKLSHNSDLVRCNTNYETLHHMLMKAFFELAHSLDIARQWIDNGLLFAAKLCQITGSPVIPQVLREAVDGASVFGSNRLRVISANEVVETYGHLQEMLSQELMMLRGEENSDTQEAIESNSPPISDACSF
ncbi:SidE phosphodiesterase domain-containing protein [Legionella lytica]|uniref:SidE phosphodiesterase domain-containing protein n=1 Tax=Legionella lytica TaxID=96232 RepID=A0ABW8D788_9GAMM